LAAARILNEEIAVGRIEIKEYASELPGNRPDQDSSDVVRRESSEIWSNGQANMAMWHICLGLFLFHNFGRKL
jgi:hypothetical protein